MAAERRVVLIAIDGSQQAEKAFDCEFDYCIRLFTTKVDRTRVKIRYRHYADDADLS